MAYVKHELADKFNSNFIYQPQTGSNFDYFKNKPAHTNSKPISTTTTIPPFQQFITDVSMVTEPNTERTRIET